MSRRGQDAEGRRYFWAVAGAGALSLAIVASWVHYVLDEPRRPSPGGSPSDARERCLGCHASPKDDPGGVHAAARLGCASCHMGDLTSTSSAAAHAGIEREPGALSTAEATCGACHARELARVRSSLMTTARGLVTVDRWAFGELPSPEGSQTIAEVLTTSQASPAEDHLRRLCAGCHLGARRDNRDDAIQGIGAGCSACHVASRPHKEAPHPAITGTVPDQQCLGCHSRSARISLSYQGLAEVAGAPAGACSSPVELFDGRKGCKLEADLHHTAGLRCTDCHLHSELMGDGVPRARAHQAVELRCESCHGPAAPVTWREVEDPITRDILRLRGEVRGPDESVRLSRRGTPVWNLRRIRDQWLLFPKAGGAPRVVTQTPSDADHTLRGHERLSCAACHAAWIPTCTSCHTELEPASRQWDFGRAAEADGAWVEHNEGMGAATPGLALDALGRIGPATPGMVARLDARKARGALREVRLVTVFDPHTTKRQARSCASCHHSAGAPPWSQLFSTAPAAATSTAARGLDREEQKKVARVGACLKCHDRPDHPLFSDFEAGLHRQRAGRTPCTGPRFGR